VARQQADVFGEHRHYRLQDETLRGVALNAALDQPIEDAGDHRRGLAGYSYEIVAERRLLPVRKQER